MDLAAIQAAISSLKAATDISKSLLEMKNMSDVQGKVIELQSALLEAQNSALAATTSQFELQEKLRELEARLNAKEDWSNVKQRYQLVSPWRGPAQAYALKKAEANGESAHLACANCFHNSKIVILNPVKPRGSHINMVCPKCDAKLDTGYNGIGPAEYVEDYESMS
ncbi:MULTISPECIES: hypothetical protein [unclassified Endozoicomonas]|uniref:hypothetical protein n=1 Tax=unclassified Endozoicomonas TaxID=2644528 RepID=UPI003BB7D3AC